MLSNSTCVKSQKECCSAVPLVLLKWWQFDLPSQISCTLDESECPTLSLVTDSKDGLKTGRAQVLSLSDALKAALQHSSMIANTIMKIDSSIREVEKKPYRQQMEAVRGSAPVTLSSASRAPHWGLGGLSSSKTCSVFTEHGPSVLLWPLPSTREDL